MTQGNDAVTLQVSEGGADGGQKEEEKAEEEGPSVDVPASPMLAINT